MAGQESPLRLYRKVEKRSVPCQHTPPPAQHTHGKRQAGTNGRHHLRSRSPLPRSTWRWHPLACKVITNTIHSQTAVVAARVARVSIATQTCRNAEAECGATDRAMTSAIAALASHAPLR